MPDVDYVDKSLAIRYVVDNTIVTDANSERVADPLSLAVPRGTRNRRKHIYGISDAAANGFG